jgi:hypothetical protein
MRSGLKITSAYGLEVDAIASNSTANLSFVSDCAVGTEVAQKSLTVTGLTTTRDLAVNGYATVSGLLTATNILCNDLKSSGTPGVKILKSDGGVALEIFDAGTAQFYSNVIADANLTVYGTLSTTSFFPIKPYAALYVQGNAISTSTNVGFLAPSAFTMTRPSNAYQFTFTNAHPNLNNYQIFVTPRTSSTNTAFFVCTAKVEVDSTAGTKFSVWCRNASNAIIDGDFWVHTVP